ncbi:DUF2063 domain-containing protein [Legionella israelensis]|uniref:DUF2063 domain-containing protein n=1 Tax=Legionella israelensis TaxID=454 RepID=A0AAX1EFZ9_9GAMM|nr:DNA-binding domain-containing protein [Legionella israelensis]QBR84070.1 DUF2063 domain-containing protein [Legionella israelensis]
MHNHLLETIQNIWIQQLTGDPSSEELHNLLIPTDYNGVAVYEESSHAALFNHLKDSFPLCCRLVGESFWYALLHQYIKTHPSKEYDINAYGGSLPLFIETFEPAKTVPSLIELSEIEWHWHILSLMSPVRPFNFEAFSRLDEADFQSLRFHLTPNLKIIQSQFPIYQIWEMNYFELDKEINLNEPGESIVLYQKENVPCIMLINEEERLFLEYLLKPLPWHQIATLLNEYMNTNRLSEILTKSMSYQWINQFTMEAV